MDWYSTALDLAGIDPPKDRVIDGISLLPLFREGKVTDRPIFYYRGDEMMAVRSGLYKAHYWTWTNSLEEYSNVSNGYHHVNACTILHVQCIVYLYPECCSGKNQISGTGTFISIHVVACWITEEVGT